MNDNVKTLTQSIQAIGEEAFPEDDVQWRVNDITFQDNHAFAVVEPIPATVGYDRFVFVIRSSPDGSYLMTSCFCWLEKWSLLFTDPSENRNWDEIVNSIE